ncbi:MAG: hypothetical protein AB7P03_05135 [Kofleriaceae bacterium]
MRWSCLAVVVCAGACGFQPSGGVATDGGATDADVDAASDVPIDAPIPTGAIDFMPASEETPGTGDLMIVGDTVLDTSAPSLIAPIGVSFVVGVQEGGTEVAILRVRDLRIMNNKRLRVIGTRPFVILAGRDIVIDGTLDVGAHGAVPGPGGAAPAEGTGKGLPGTHQANGNADSGGGGGSFGSVGARGGDSDDQDGGGPGDLYSPDILIGGSSGGLARAMDCPYPSGAGGGAVLMFAAHKVQVKGAITAGGGGGAGGAVCTTLAGAGSGTGGGSGGLIWIQTLELGGDGVLAANGGGAGGGGYAKSNAPGMSGQDGQPATETVARGGAPADAEYGSAGGDGAIDGKPATRGGDRDSGNAGGGGGGVGRIITRTPTTPTLNASPAMQWSAWN